MNLSVDSAQFAGGLKNAQKRLRKVGQSMRDTGRQLSTYVSVPLLGAGAAILKASGDFEKGMQAVRAVLKPTEQDFKGLRDLAYDLGQTTQFSATAAASGIEMLARNGLDATKIMDGAADATLKLAAASGGELAPSADLITDVMVNFKKSAKDLPGIVDNIAGVLAESKLGFEDYTAAAGQAAGTSGAMGLSVEDMNAALAITAPSFASGEEAGTSFKGMLLKLASPTKQAAELMKANNLQFFDAKGNMKSLAGIAETLKTNLGDLSKQKQGDILGKLFGQRTIRSALRLMEAGAEGVNKIKTAIAGVSAEQMAAERLKGFNGQMKLLKSAAESLAIAIGESGMLGALTQLVEKLTEFTRYLSETSPQILKWGTIIGGIAIAIGPVVFAFGAMASAVGALIPVITGLGTAISALIAATGPIGLLAVAVAGIVTAWQNWDTIGPILENLYTAAKNWLQDKLGSVLNWVKGKVKGVGDTFKWLYDQVVGHSWVPDMVNEIGQWMGRLQDNMVAPASMAVDQVNGKMGELGDVGRRIGQSIGSAFAGLIDGSKNVKDVLADLLKQLTSMLANQAFQYLTSGLFGGGGFLGNIFKGLTGFAGGGEFAAGGASTVAVFR